MRCAKEFPRQVALPTVFIALSCCLANGCQALDMKPKLPRATTDTVSMPLKKVLNPAFNDEVAGKWIRFDAGFGGVMDWVTDLPPEFRTGYVRLFLSDAEDGFARTANAVIAKEKSDPVFAVQPGSAVFEVLAYIQPIVLTMNTGVSQSSVLLVIDSLRKKE